MYQVLEGLNGVACIADDILVYACGDTSAGLMPTEARGNYLPEAPYLRETKTYLNCNRVCSAWVHRTCLITIYQYDYRIIQ